MSWPDGLEADAEQIADMIQRPMPTPSGTIDYEEFLTMMAAAHRRQRQGGAGVGLQARARPARARRRYTPRGRRAAPAMRIPSPALPPSRARRLFDLDGSGDLSPAEIRGLMTSVGDSPMSHEEVEELLRLADPQNTGTISKEKFMGLPCWKVPGM